ncbi:MAG: hypothetical protein KBA26_15140, partial [Candidatus Delongbacteria bacterium]|nr:hypothetical protein [Candidatus Delongbacteria bacterium]
MFRLGIDIGYSSLKCVVLDESDRLVHFRYELHRGDIRGHLIRNLEEVKTRFGLSQIGRGALTGSGSKRFEGCEGVTVVKEIPALVEGTGFWVPEACSIMDIGGQNTKYITGLEGENRSGIKVSMNSNCAAGTGSFLEEQVSRLNLRLEDYSDYAARADSIPRIAGRCSVFAKTDIIHHQQEGVKIENILLGLAYAVVKNYKASVIQQLPLIKPVLLTGGVAFNQGLVRALHDVLGLTDNELIIPDPVGGMGAIGAAVMAGREGISIDLETLLNRVSRWEGSAEKEIYNAKLPALNSFGRGDSDGKHVII